jgi:hypothetical protein
MLGLLTSKIVYELEACLENRLSDVVCARLGRSAQDEMHARRSSSHPGTFAARVRNRVSGSAGIWGLELGDAGPGEGSPADGGPDLYMMRGRTLGGRFTARGGQPTVIQQEVVLSADEVMLEVAHSLVAAGHRLIAIAGEEFLVQVSGSDAERAREAVRGAAEAGAARLLGTRLLGTAHPRECDHAIQVEPSDVW